MALIQSGFASGPDCELLKRGVELAAGLTTVSGQLRSLVEGTNDCLHVMDRTWAWVEHSCLGKYSMVQ